MNNKLIESIKNGTTHMWMWKPGGDNCSEWDEIETEDGDIVAMSSGEWYVNIGSYEQSKTTFDNDYNIKLGKENAHVKATCLWNFAKKVEIGDIIVACTLENISGKLRYHAIGWCVVSSSYFYDPEYEEQHYREVEDVHDLDKVVLPITVDNKKNFFAKIVQSEALAACNVLGL